MATPIFDWLNTRGAGLLLHPTAIPSDTGIGTLGADARELIDFIQTAKLKYWQVCPLGHTGYGDSPYQCFSAFAGNPYLIDLEELIGKGLLSAVDLNELKRLPWDHVDYGEIFLKKWPVLRLAFKNFIKAGALSIDGYGDYAAFKEQYKDWLEPYSLFMALKEFCGGKEWLRWDQSIRTFQSASNSEIKEKVSDKQESYRFFQYVFYNQWLNLKQYANDKDIQIIGDIPIFVALDSADVWSNHSIFQLDEHGCPEAVGGVPPDYFSPTGQLWGNPLYNWEALKESGYDWWLNRFAATFELYDVVRLDHFRGFEAYWRIPATAKDARSGKWMPGPRLDFLQAVKARFPDAQIIAEDLGEITKELQAFTKASGLPGMAVLQFAFSCEPDNIYLPHMLKPNCVIYTGTHDNNTTKGWWIKEAADKIKSQARRYLRIKGDEISYDFIRTAYNSVCNLAIIPMQDFLALGQEARFNTPGKPAGNWQWRYTREQLEHLKGDTTLHLQELAWLHRR